MVKKTADFKGQTLKDLETAKKYYGCATDAETLRTSVRVAAQLAVSK